ncbi:response regulator transcription factor [Enterococcus sp. BWR-S5]|uniref:response regulator transcription factor n=1 Tax=Enterococcus sp. BWR-S5 TaxID=2787714 RepID=UPI0019222F49|nr:helix-turn-helix domain-containing protein [Enterococcus sp. BWR-S5]MBL1224667.1 AraC family transcriptional regulator [Enterococcus sp. BWR-S5]
MGAILIVEDEMLERDFLKAIVMEEVSANHVVLSCSTGGEAVALAKQHCPEILFLDILIPEKDGLSVLEEIRTFLPDSKAVILSAFSDFSYAQKAIDLNVSKYMLKPVKPREITAILHRLMGEIADSKKQAVPEAEREIVAITEIQGFIKEALHFIQENYKEKITLQKVSAHVYMNPQYFSRVFKREVGLSYTDYVNNLRIDYACKLLETSDYPSYRISSECGFNDPSYFNRVFYRQMSTTPNKYRKNAHIGTGS